VTGEPERVPADVRAFADVLADVLAERGLLVAASAAQPSRVLDAAQVADLLGRDRHWVYAHADELGAFRYSDRPTARLGFDHARVEQWKRERRTLRTPFQKLKRTRRAATAETGEGPN
jgi:predicted DNA-binding transcriptional regulator AlpA